MRDGFGHEVPEGPSIVARHFSGGWADETMRVPWARLNPTAGQGFSRPYGTGILRFANPALKRRATIGRPSGTPNHLSFVPQAAAHCRASLGGTTESGCPHVGCDGSPNF